MTQELHRRPRPSLPRTTFPAASAGMSSPTAPSPTMPVIPRRQTARRLIGGLLSRRAQLILLIGIVVGTTLAFTLVPPVRAEVGHSWDILRTGDQHQIGDYLRAFGAWGPVISLAMMVGQAIVAPIPGALVVFANGIAFGTFWGTVLSVVGQTMAAMVCFWIARLLGRGPVEAMVGRFGLDSLDRWFGRWGAFSIVVLRLVPGVAFDGVSYGAGLLRIRFRTFVVATVIGVLPQSLFYTWMIQRYPGLAVGITVVALSIFTGTALIGIIAGLRRRRATLPGTSITTHE